MMSTRSLLGYSLLYTAIIASILFADYDLALAFAAMKQQSPVLIAPFQAITTLGKSQWYLYPLALYLVWAWVMSKQQPEQRARWLRHLQIAGFIFANIAVSGLAADAVKILVGRPRPVLLIEQDIFNQLSPFIFKSRWWSFPSGHSITGLSLALSVGAFWPRWRWVLLGLAGLIAASRVIVTAHYLSDTLAGLGLGVIIFSLLTMLFKKRGWQHKHSASA